jgi:2-keto-4-pentenoate hydratase/2-oxohepta-3-ene-1,7-dioic acid hydratase in catechol pathway
MRFATYTEASDGPVKVGVVSTDGKTLTPLNFPADQARRGVLCVVDYCNDGSDLNALMGQPVSMQSVQLLAPVPRPQRNVFCVGRNYHAHAKELSGSVFKANSADPASWPIVFTKVPESVIGPRDQVVLPGANVSEQIDYEAELAVIIGTGGKNIRPEDAMKHVFGYTIINDVTARDVQMRHQQWDLGKSFDTFCPMGPWVVTADELDGTNTRVQCWVNGQQRQDGHTRDFIFDIPALIEACSRGITLYPGDIIATGTPAGVGMGLTPPQYLKHGDTVRIEIDGIGVLENTFTHA